MGAGWVLGCRDVDFNPQTGTCAAPYYIPQTTGFPALSIADAQTIGAACALLWAAAWVIRRIKKQLDQS